MTTSSTPTIRFAIIGVGLIGPRHVDAVERCNDGEVVAIVDPAPASQQLATRLGVAYYTSVKDLLQSEHKPDAAIICTPNHTHVPIARELSSGNVHILVEKPLSTDVPSGVDLISHLKSTGVKTLVGHHRRFNPYIVETKRIISSGVLGNIIAINGLWTTYKPSDYFQPPTAWRADETGGVVLINMIHDVDLLHHLFGPITRVHAERTISQRGHKAEEGAALTLRFKSGVVGTFLISDNVPSPYSFESGTGENPTIPHTGQDFYRIFGSEASLSVPDMSIWSYNGTVKSWTSKLSHEKAAVTNAVPFDLQLEHFCRVVRGQESPSCTAMAGLAALTVCQAIKEAIKGNTTVEVEKYEL